MTNIDNLKFGEIMRHMKENDSGKDMAVATKLMLAALALGLAVVGGAIKNETMMYVAAAACTVFTVWGIASIPGSGLDAANK